MNTSDDGAHGTQVPRYDLTSDFADIWPEVNEGLMNVAEKGEFILGEPVERFEEEFSWFQGVQHTIGVGSGTDALEFALRAVGVGAGEEVILPANTFYASAAAAMRIGAVPVLVDCDAEYYQLDARAVRDALTPRTGAVMPVHMYGQTAPMAAIREIAAASGVPIVEDCAQAHGSTYNDVPAGGFGAASGTSFHPHKNLAAWGDGGAVLTDDPQVAAHVRRMRQYGGDEYRVHTDVGWNSRLDTVQAVVLLARLARLTAGNNTRNSIANRYTDAFSSIDGIRTPTVAPGNVSTWHLYVVEVEDRDRIAGHMREAGIGVSVDYATPLHLHPGLRDLGYRKGAFPVAEAASAKILSLPMYPSLKDHQVDRVASTLIDAVLGRSAI